MSIRYQFDAIVSDRHRIDVDLRAFAIWELGLVVPILVPSSLLIKPVEYPKQMWRRSNGATAGELKNNFALTPPEKFRPVTFISPVINVNSVENGVCSASIILIVLHTDSLNNLYYILHYIYIYIQKVKNRTGPNVPNLISVVDSGSFKKPLFTP